MMTRTAFTPALLAAASAGLTLFAAAAVAAAVSPFFDPAMIAAVSLGLGILAFGAAAWSDRPGVVAGCGIAGLVLGGILALTGPALAADAAASPPAAITDTLATAVIDLAAAGVLGLAAWVLRHLGAWLKLKQDSEVRGALTQAADNAGKLARAQLGVPADADVPQAVLQSALDIAADYMRRRVGGSLSRFGLDAEDELHLYLAPRLTTDPAAKVPA